MRFIVVILALTVLAEFRAEVHGEPTLIGCYIRGFDGVEDGRCGKKSTKKMPKTQKTLSI